MKQKILFGLCAGAFLSLWIAGCNKSSPTGTSGGSVSTSDQQSLDNIISNDALLTNDAATLDDGAASTSLSLDKATIRIMPLSAASIATAITPYAWGRTFSSWSGNKAYDQINDSTVVATITNTLTGTLWIDTSANGGFMRKPIVMTTVRNVKFEKRVIKDSTQWVEKFVSAMQGITNSGTDTIYITDVTFFMGTDTIDITSPAYNDYLLMGAVGRLGLHMLPQSASRIFTIQATVVSTSPDSDRVVVHYPNAVTDTRIRRQMRHVAINNGQAYPINNGNGTFTHLYRWSWIGDYPGRHTIIVSALSKRTLYDSQAPVTSQDWGIPYIVQ